LTYFHSLYPGNILPAELPVIIHTDVPLSASAVSAGGSA
jgi:hypothetical protein